MGAAHTEAAVDRPPATVDREAEQMLIGAALCGGVENVDVYAQVDGASLVDAFADPNHRQVWGLIGELHGRGEPVVLETVARLARDHGYHGSTPADLGNWAMRVGEYWGPPALAMTYAQRVAGAAARRRLHALASRLASQARDNHQPLTDWLPENLQALLTVPLPSTKKASLSGLVMDVLDEVESARHAGANVIPSGLHSVDQAIGGWWAGELHVLAGRASMGKTGAALTVAANAARSGHAVGFLTCEMSREQIVKRILALETGVSVTRIWRGWVNAQETIQLHEAGARIATWPLMIEEPADSSWPTVALGIRRMAIAGAKVVFVDYLGLLSYPGKGLGRWEQIGRMTSEAVRLAKELGVAVVLLSQINREVGKEKDKRPSLFHLAEGGKIEQDAAIILLLHRPGYYDDLAPQDRAECIVAKNRHGPRSTVHLRWHGETAQFVDEAVYAQTEWTS